MIKTQSINFGSNIDKNTEISVRNNQSVNFGQSYRDIR